MKMSRKVLSLALCLALLLTALSCALGEADRAGQTRRLRLGSSSYTIDIDLSYRYGELSGEDMAGGQMAYLYSDDLAVDFDVYQFAVDGNAMTLADFVAEAADAHGDASEVVTDGEINGIPVGWFRAVEKYEDREYRTVTYVLDGGTDYVEIVFWLDGEDAEAAVAGMIGTLAFDDLNAIRLGSSPYWVLCSVSFKEGGMTSAEVADDQVAYWVSEETQLDFDVYQFSKEGLPENLADYVAEEAATYDSATDIVPQAEVNGIPVGWYRTVEEYDGRDYDTLTYVLDADGEYIEVVFWLDGPSAAAEADEIVKSLWRDAPGTAGEDVIGTLGGWLEDTLGDVSEALEEKAGDAGAWARETADKVGDALQENISAAGAWAKETAGKAGDALEARADAAGEAIGAFGTWIADAVDGIAGDVRGAADSVPVEGIAVEVDAQSAEYEVADDALAAEDEAVADALAAVEVAEAEYEDEAEAAEAEYEDEAEAAEAEYEAEPEAAEAEYEAEAEAAEAEYEDEAEAAAGEDVPPRPVADAGDGATQLLRLGTSPLCVLAPADFVEGEMTQEDIADDQVAYYYSEQRFLDFDIYQFSKEGYPSALAEYAIEESSGYNGVSELVTDGEINGIPTAWYRTVEEYEEAEYNTITYIMDVGDEYVEVVFWLDGETADAEADAIIRTLTDAAGAEAPAGEDAAVIEAEEEISEAVRTSGDDDADGAPGAEAVGDDDADGVPGAEAVGDDDADGVPGAEAVGDDDADDAPGAGE